jgi:hypothetical protein
MILERKRLKIITLWVYLFVSWLLLLIASLNHLSYQYTWVLILLGLEGSVESIKL